MKITFSKSATEGGSVLVVTLCAAVVIGVTLASYLTLVENQTRAVSRSQAWNTTMVVTEAGLEDGLELINKFAASPNLPQWTNSYAADNWTQISANIYYTRRYMGAGKGVYYDVYVTNSVSDSPRIYAIGYLPTSSANAAVAPAALGVSSRTLIARAVAVQTQRDPMFDFALAALNAINASGNNVATDSFDSMDSNYSTDGKYDPAKNKDGGDIMVNSGDGNVINIGNANIMGKAKTAAGGTVSVGSNGSIGSESWVEGGNVGIEPGWTASDMNVSFPSVSSPTIIYPGQTWYQALPVGGTVDGITYNSIITSSGFYKVSSLPDKTYIATNATAVIWVTDSVKFSGDDRLDIAPEGASLTVYAGGPVFNVSGQAGVNNYSQNAINFNVFGLPTCTSMTFGGNTAFTGTIYAPQADVKLNGGGNTVYDFVGAGLFKSVTLVGHFNFHYDENLRRLPWGRGYIPANWQEI